MVYGIIYRYTNKVNGKVYIGQTKNPSRRKADHKSCCLNGRGSYLHTSMRKHGFDNFLYEEIDTAIDKQSLDLLEKHYIQIHDSNTPERGYNLTVGGPGIMEGRKHTMLSKQRMSVTKKGIPNFRLRNHTRTSSHCSNISLSKKGSIPTATIKRWEVTTPTGEVLRPFNLAQYARDNKLNRGHLANSGRIHRTHKGYRAIELTS